MSLLVAGAVFGPAVAPSRAGDARPLRIVEFEYSEDYEGIGRHYSVFATLRGEATRVRARVGELKAQGRPSSSGPGEIWDFTDRTFVKGVRADLEADGLASVTVRRPAKTPPCARAARWCSSATTSSATTRAVTASRASPR